MKIVFSMIPATKSHIDYIMEIEKDCFIPQIQEDRQVFLERLESPTFFLFIDDQTQLPVGYISGEYMDHMPKSASQIALNHHPGASPITGNAKNASFFYISSFGILGKYRGQGNGKILWRMALDYYKTLPGVKTLILLVNEDWKGAHHIYTDYGFTEVARFQEFFPRTDGTSSTGILMKMEIE